MNSVSRLPSVMFVILAVFSLVWSEPTIGAEPASAEDNKDQVLKVLERFFSCEQVGDKPAALKHSRESVTVTREEFSVNRGHTVVASFPGFRCGIALTDSRLEWLIDLAERPEDHAAYEIVNGQKVPTDLEQKKRELVKIESKQALKIAESFVESHLGPKALLGLTLVSSDLVNRGCLFVYTISWKNLPDETGVTIGLEYIRVDVNPSTGGIPEYHHTRSIAPDDYLINADQARTIAVREHGHLPGFEIGALSLVSRYKEDGEMYPVWVVSSKVHAKSKTSPLLGGPNAFHGKCEIDANTGNVISLVP